MSSFSPTDLRNLNQFVALKFAANMATIVSLTVVPANSQTRTFYGVVADMTSGTASYVPFVATVSDLTSGLSGSGVPVDLHTDKAAPALADAITAAVALLTAGTTAAIPTFVNPTGETDADRDGV